MTLTVTDAFANVTASPIPTTAVCVSVTLSDAASSSGYTCTFTVASKASSILAPADECDHKQPSNLLWLILSSSIGSERKPQQPCRHARVLYGAPTTVTFTSSSGVASNLMV